MTFIDDLKTKVNEALKRGEEGVLEKNIFRFVLGEIDTLVARNGSATVDQCLSIVRKIAEKNKETVDILQQKINVLNQENAILSTLLPKTLSVQEIKEVLVDAERLQCFYGQLAEIKAAKSDGQATGIAMKTLKALNSVVTGNDVSQAVKELRT